MDLIESDATYCSEVEKQNFSQLRRSKRLSQKLDQSFRSDEDPVLQRFEEIHRMVESDGGCKDYSKEDWCALKTEVNSLRKALKCVPKPRLTFLIKKIEQKLRILKIETSLQDFSKLTKECARPPSENVLCESVKSPNVLAGMTTELLTEIPLYQPDHLAATTKMTNKTNINTEPTGGTQVNPLDLTKRVCKIPVNDCAPEVQTRNDKPEEGNGNVDLSHCATIDLTEASQKIKYNGHINQSVNQSVVASTSKWLKYLPTQHRPQEPSVPLSQQEKPKRCEQSLIKLYDDISITTSPHRSKKPKTKKIRKSKQKHNLKRHFNPQYLRNTESVFRRDCEFDSVQLRDVHTENVAALRQDSSSGDFGQDVLTFSDDKSSVSLPFSLKMSFKKVFGTDNLREVLGCEKIAYSLTERHVEQLAKALSIQKDALKAKIEEILLEDNCIPVNDDALSETSVLECSQSPTPRLHPSQRSQVQK